jgi:hypothetical protein
MKSRDITNGASRIPGRVAVSKTEPVFEARITRLERSLRGTRFAAYAVGFALFALAGVQCAGRSPTVLDEVRARRIVLVDDEGRIRVELAQDPRNTQRRARSAGLRVFDNTGHERGGFATFDDGSVVLAMDAPHGVGDPMPDRLGLMVSPDGSADLMLLDNQTRAVAKLVSDGSGGGGVQVFKWDMGAKQIHVRTVTYDGDQRETTPMGPPS